MPPVRKANSRNSGLLSGVFNFVSREFEQFVANATGSSVPVCWLLFYVNLADEWVEITGAIYA